MFSLFIFLTHSLSLSHFFSSLLRFFSLFAYTYVSDALVLRLSLALARSFSSVLQALCDEKCAIFLCASLEIWFSTIITHYCCRYRYTYTICGWSAAQRYPVNIFNRHNHIRWIFLSYSLHTYYICVTPLFILFILFPLFQLCYFHIFSSLKWKKIIKNNGACCGTEAGTICLFDFFILIMQLCRNTMNKKENVEKK